MQFIYPSATMSRFSRKAFCYKNVLDKKPLICYDIQGFSIAHISKHKSHKPCFYKSF